jgi:tungstate transport system ATP-binding protein
LKHAYGGKPVLSVDHLDLQPASIVGLIGPNGSGKSSLLRILGLVEKPNRGEIRFHGRRVEPFSENTRFMVTLLPQEPFLMKRSVQSNVSYGLKLRGRNGKDVISRVRQALSVVGLPFEDFADRPWYALSGGEMQRVALAARLALQPRVLLLDEPTASVDAASAQLIKEATLRARRELGTTLVVASHDWQWLFEICDEILHLFQGRIFGTGRETIVFGPWQTLGSKKWGKILSDGQQLVVPRPPTDQSAALIEGLHISRNGAPHTGKENVLHGIVSRLSLERKTGQVFATILAGDLPVTVRLSPDQSKTHAFSPGETVSIYYFPNQVSWI